MRTLAFTLLLLPFASLAELVEHNQHALIGTWLLEWNQDEIVDECPDEIVLQSDGSYKILNDCFGGYDVRLPVVEEGRWKFNAGSKQIAFTNRSFETDYTMHGSSDPLTAYVKSITTESLILCFWTEEGWYEERYRRVPSQISPSKDFSRSDEALPLAGGCPHDANPDNPIDFEADPDQVASSIEHAVESAFIYWTHMGATGSNSNQYADEGAGRDEVVRVSANINGWRSRSPDVTLADGRQLPREPVGFDDRLNRFQRLAAKLELT